MVESNGLTHSRTCHEVQARYPPLGAILRKVLRGCEPYGPRRAPRNTTEMASVC